jgi:hypothetical protein
METFQARSKATLGGLHGVGRLGKWYVMMCQDFVLVGTRGRATPSGVRLTL